ncbi:TPA: hypothetical protein ACS72K_003944 [Providencia alcalifaciens]
METPAKPALISNVTGLDMGLSHYAIKSDGSKVSNPRHLINASRHLSVILKEKRQKQSTQSAVETCRCS